LAKQKKQPWPSPKLFRRCCVVRRDDSKSGAWLLKIFGFSLEALSQRRENPDHIAVVILRKEDAMINITRLAFTNKNDSSGCAGLVFILGSGDRSVRILIRKTFLFDEPTWTSKEEYEASVLRSGHSLEHGAKNIDKVLEVPGGHVVKVVKPHDHWQEPEVLEEMLERAFFAAPIDNVGPVREWKSRAPEMIIVTRMKGENEPA